MLFIFIHAIEIFHQVCNLSIDSHSIIFRDITEFITQNHPEINEVNYERIYVERTVFHQFRPYKTLPLQNKDRIVKKIKIIKIMRYLLQLCLEELKMSLLVSILHLLRLTQ